MTQLRGWALAVCTALSMGLFPQVSYGGVIFDYDGVGTLGGVVWDGDADVGTMNNPPCVPNDLEDVPDTCETDVFNTALMDLSDLELFISGGATRADFSTLDVAFTVGDCVAFDAFVLAGDATCGNLESQLPNPANEDFNSGSVDDFAQILRLPFGFDVGPGGGYLLDDVDALELAGLAALLNGLHFGVIVGGASGPYHLEIRTDAVAVPEPVSLLLVGFGLAAAGASRARRRSKTARS